MPPKMQIRRLSSDDDLEQITRLIHLAYAPHAALGLRYWGTHQTVADTATRFASGQGFIAEEDGECVGTITVRPPQPESSLAPYRDAHTWSLCQFAVSPRLKGAGIGRTLHDMALAHAHRHGGRTMMIDTAAPATGLIAMYRAWGYRHIGMHSWQPHTNFESVVMSLAIGEAMDGAERFS